MICSPPVFWVVFKLLPKAQQGFPEPCAKPTVCSPFKHSLSAHLDSMTLSTFLDIRLTRSDLTQKIATLHKGPSSRYTDKPQPSDCKPFQQENSDSSGKIVSNKRALDCQGLELYSWICFMLNPFLQSQDSPVLHFEFTVSFQICMLLIFLYKLHLSYLEPLDTVWTVVVCHKWKKQQLILYSTGEKIQNTGLEQHECNFWLLAESICP